MALWRRLRMDGHWGQGPGRKNKTKLKSVGKAGVMFTPVFRCEESIHCFFEGELQQW